MKSARRLSLYFLLVPILGIASLPGLSGAAEFSFAGPPAFTFTYPDSATPGEKTAPEQVWAVKTSAGVDIQASVAPIPEGIDLKDVAEKAYKPGLEQALKTAAKMSDNKEIALGDGTKAYYSEISWTHPPTQTAIVTVMVSAYKDGKWIFVTGHPWENFAEPMRIVKSLKFK